ncbi:hypothetical protein PISMIDRAFT_682701, partial [Pisolithus microcarpus 441]
MDQARRARLSGICSDMKIEVDKTVSGKLLGGTVAPADEDVAGGSGSDVGGARFGNNIYCLYAREGHRDENATAYFKGRGGH